MCYNSRMDTKSDIIVAIATPYGKSGVGIVRLSGTGSLNLGKKMFRPYSKTCNFEPNKMFLGEIDLGELKDKGFMVYFACPHSFTGEDIVEFQCHGGVLILEKIVNRCLSLGARMAEPGEFSKRAFLNGKMSLDEAEGVADLINAESESELRCSFALARGELKGKVCEIQQKVLDSLCELQVNLDYPEEKIEISTRNELKKVFDEVCSSIDGLLSTAKQGHMCKFGVDVAIVGKTNAGKSSLLNRLLGTEQAIVTDIEGTTRDVVSGVMEYKGVKFNLLDTAGLRETDDIIENIGIDKTKQMIEQCDVVLLVIDRSRKTDKQDEENFALTAGKNRIIVLNKLDKKDETSFSNNLANEKVVSISAKSGENVDKLKDLLFDTAFDGKFINDSLIITNARHSQILSQASEFAHSLLEKVESEFLDCVSLDCQYLWEKLGEITGVSANDEIIKTIFSKFCLGK